MTAAPALTVIRKAKSELASAMLDMERDLRHQNRSERTIETYRWAVEKLDRFLAERGRPCDPAQVTKDDIREFTTREREQHSAVTAHTYFSALRAFFSFCLREDIIERSPMATLKAPARGTTPVPLVTDAEVRALLAATSGRAFMDRRDHAIFRLLLDTGARRQEIMSLSVDDVDLDAQPPSVLIRKAKGGKVRRVYFGNLAAKALSAYLRARRTHKHAALDALWVSPYGPIVPHGLNAILVSRCRRAGVRLIGAHQFRHTFAHHQLSNGMQEGDLMRLGGWTNASMIHERYGASAADERARDAYLRQGAPGDKL